MSLKDHVYDYISDAINNGTLHPNEKLNEVEISEKLNVSRTPIREALIQLASDGYLENIPRKGFIVRQIDENKAKEIYAVIGTLEGRAAFLSFEHIEESDIKEMEFLVDSMEIAIRELLYDKYFDLQIEFHNIYILKCGNSQLIDLLNQVKKIFMKKRYEKDINGNMQDVLFKTNSEHREILNLFKNGSKDELEKYIRDIHWSEINARFETN